MARLGNFAMAFDETNHRLFIGCRTPSKLVVLNTDSGNVVASIDISGDPDDVFYDSKRRRIYAICGAGKIDIIKQTDANTYEALLKRTRRMALALGFFVPERDSLFIAVPHRGQSGSGDSLLPNQIICRKASVDFMWAIDAFRSSGYSSAALRGATKGMSFT